MARRGSLISIDKEVVIKESKENEDYDEQLAQEFQDQIDFLRAGRNDEVQEIEEDDPEDVAPSEILPNARRRSSIIVSSEGDIMKKFAAPDERQTTKLLSPEKKREIIQIFNLFDTDGSGTMEMGELKVVLWALGFQPEPGDPEKMVANYFKITTEEADDICLSVDDFLEFAVEILTNRDSVDSLKKSFACFDAEDKGYLVMKDLMRVCKEIHENFSDEDLEMMMAHIDKDGGGSVTLDEWITVMSDAF